MFKKRKKKVETNQPVATSHPLFDFSVLDSDMRAAARDYSALKAFAAVQKPKESAKQPAPQVIAPAPAPVPKVAPATKKPVVSRFVILSSLFLLLAAGLGAGGILWSLRNQDVEIPVVTAPPVVSPPPTTAPPVNEQPPSQRVDEPGRDTDNDGLTDAEERLFSTDARNPDTDEDTYLDNNEVFHGYDPNIAAPALLKDSSVAAEYTYAGDPRFRFLKLNQWSVEAPTIVPEGSQGSLRLLTTSGSEFRITLHAREPEQTLGDWYDASPQLRESYGLANEQALFVSKQGYTGRVTNNKRAAFLDVGEYIAVFEYDLRTERTVEYALVFQMLLNSFTMLP